MPSNVAPINMGPEAVILTEGNVNSGILSKECNKLLNNENYWHKIIVQSRADITIGDFILKTILDNIYPLDFIPVCYTTENRYVSFFVRNCAKAIGKLCHQKLIVENPENLHQPFRLMIILAFSNTTELVVNVQENIAQALTKRYNWFNKYLNLNRFHTNPNIKVFCTLSQPKIFKYVLRLSKQMQLLSLRMAYNDIHMISSMEDFREMKLLTSLDLSFNRIENISELNVLKTMQITELNLQGNPLCDLYNEVTYLLAVKEVCPKIQKLDGVLVQKGGFPPYRYNFLCDHDGHELVNQFLEHFFTFYDSPFQVLLHTLYHENAMFSLTCSYLVGQMSTSTSNLGVYKSMQRNIKLMCDLAKSEQRLMIGPENICGLFATFPTTEHDPYSFTADLVYYSEVTAIITVTGVFRETTESLLDAPRYVGFARTFVLLKVDNNEFKIVNEQLHVSNATTSQEQRAFKLGKPHRQISLQIFKPTSDAEENEMTNAFKLLTNLNLEWSKRFLEDCDYDFRKSLMLFVDLYKADKIPEFAFAQIPEATNNAPIIPEFAFAPIPEATNNAPIIPEFAFAPIPEGTNNAPIIPEVAFAPIPKATNNVSIIPKFAFAPIPGATNNASVSKMFKRKSGNRKQRAGERRVLIITPENEFMRMPRTSAIAQGIISEDYTSNRIFLFDRTEDIL